MHLSIDAVRSDLSCVFILFGINLVSSNCWRIKIFYNKNPKMFFSLNSILFVENSVEIFETILCTIQHFLWLTMYYPQESEAVLRSYKKFNSEYFEKQLVRKFPERTHPYSADRCNGLYPHSSTALTSLPLVRSSCVASKYLCQTA